MKAEGKSKALWIYRLSLYVYLSNSWLSPSSPTNFDYFVIKKRDKYFISNFSEYITPKEKSLVVPKPAYTLIMLTLSVGLRIYILTVSLAREQETLPRKQVCSWCDSKLSDGEAGECRLLFRFLYSQVHSKLEWEYLLVPYLWVK